MVRLGILAAALAAMSAGPASAIVYTGTISIANGGLTGTDDWLGGPTSITYTVADDPVVAGLWHYVYTIAVPNTPGGAIHEVLIGLDPAMTVHDLRNVSLTNGNLHSVELFQNQGDKKFMPQPMYAVEFIVGADTRTLTITFDSLFEPVWGDVFVRGGGQNSCWNIDFTATSTDPPVLPSVFQAGFILRPGIIPEPMTMVTLGLAGLAVARALQRRLRGA
ncbi:MAG: hypothetical protein FWE88_02630 [Phycisphaerae bacterium]|nr:hypothetical protein [Phycisphaerae bacterium]